MCDMREVVKVVGDDELDVAWAVAVSVDGRRVVFIRHSDQALLPEYCAAGHGCCPVYRALTLAA